MIVLDEVLTLLKERNLFLTGGGGVGKSHLLKEVIRKYKDQNRNVIVLASTGIAAVNINGSTIHSFFLFGISSDLNELDKFDRKNRAKLKELQKTIKALDLLVIDEISMVSGSLMEMIHFRLLNLGFNGKVLLSGDFCQLPPVEKNIKQNTLFTAHYSFESYFWDKLDLVIYELTNIKRTDDLKFMEILQKIRLGYLDEEILSYLNNLQKEKTLTNPTTLFGTNNEANFLNVKKLNELNKTQKTYVGKLEVKDSKFPMSKISSWIKALPIEEELILKVGVPVIFTINKWGSYSNGEKGIVRSLNDTEIIVETSRGYLEIAPYEFTYEIPILGSDGIIKDQIVCTFNQYPIKIAYAITIHKSQGMGIDNLVCNVNSIFTDSQFYVAISRATNPQNLQIIYTRGEFSHYLRRVLRVNEKVLNFYKQKEIKRVNN